MKRFKLKFLSPLGLAVLAIFALNTQQASAATYPTLAVVGVPTQGSGTFSSNGYCNTNGNVSFSLVNSNGVTTNLGTTANTSAGVNSSGQFGFNATNLVLPPSVTTGPATLVATCPNGDTVTSSIVVSDPASSVLLGFNNPNQTMIGNVTATGLCGVSNASGNPIVTFDLSQNGSVFSPVMTTTPSVPTTAVGANGNFSAVLNIPTNFAPGLATLRAICSNGKVLSNLVVLGTPTSVTFPSGSTNTPAVAGVSITPTGGVNAGSGSTSANNYRAIEIALAAFAIGGAAAFILKSKLS